MQDDIKKQPTYKIVGRDSRIDLSAYTVTINGREIVDYEKLRRENPDLYKEILRREHEENDEYLS